jgi:hypothetical protein
VEERGAARLDPPNVLWFFGAYTLVIGVYELLRTIPDSRSGLWLLIAAVAFLTAFAIAAAVLLRWGWWVPGGLAAALAVGVFPAAAIAFLTMIQVWPSDPFFEPLQRFSGWTFGVGVATALIGFLAWWLSRFSFVLAVAIGAVLVTSQLLTPCFDESSSADERVTMALVIGAILFVAGVFIDAFGGRREAFWFEVLGLFSIAGGLVYLTAEPGGDPARGWIPMLIGGVILLVAAAPIRRASWAIYGVLGVYAAVVHYLVKELDEQRWPFALMLIVLAVLLFATGMAQHRYGRTWAQRFVRRPPPELGT